MNDEAKQPFDFWALVELFGHQRIAGHVTEQQLGGDAFVRVDAPDDKGEIKFTRLFGPKAIYAINPTSKEVCIKLANAIDAAPVKAWDLPKELPAGATGAPPEDYQTNCQECGELRENCSCAVGEE